MPDVSLKEFVDKNLLVAQEMQEQSEDDSYQRIFFVGVAHAYKQIKELLDRE